MKGFSFLKRSKSSFIKRWGDKDIYFSLTKTGEPVFSVHLVCTEFTSVKESEEQKGIKAFSDEELLLVEALTRQCLKTEWYEMDNVVYDYAGACSKRACFVVKYYPARHQKSELGRTCGEWIVQVDGVLLGFNTLFSLAVQNMKGKSE